MDWNTLVSVVIGGLIATIGSFLNNRFQAQERQKDREEQRRYNKIQAKQKWVERDILRMMDLLESMMKLLREERGGEWAEVILEDKKEAGVLTDEEFEKAHGILIARISERIDEADNTMEVMARLSYSFEPGDLVASYKKFEQAVEAWVAYDTHGPHPHRPNKKRNQESGRLWLEVMLAAGDLHRALREELISITDN